MHLAIEARGYLSDELRGETLPMSCSDFFQPFIDYLNQPTADPQIFNMVNFLLAGNRAETADTRFVLYTQGFFDEVVVGEPTQLTGSAFQLFSNKSDVTSGTEQPFDIHLSQEVKVSLAVPGGPLAFGDRARRRRRAPGDVSGGVARGRRVQWPRFGQDVVAADSDATGGTGVEQGTPLALRTADRSR